MEKVYTSAVYRRRGRRGMEKENRREIPIEEVVKILEDLGYKVTPQRIIVTKIILENVKNHPSFKEIHEMASKQLPRLGISTTYTIMKMLEKSGLITTFEAGGDTHIDSPEPHVNIVCDDTGEIYDLDNIPTDLLVEAQKLLKSQGINTERMTIIIKTRCDSNRKG